MNHKKQVVLEFTYSALLELEVTFPLENTSNSSKLSFFAFVITQTVQFAFLSKSSDFVTSWMWPSMPFK